MKEQAQTSLDEARDHFDKWNASCRDGEFDEIDQEIRARGERVLELMGELGGEFPRILEVGCGTGWLAGRLASMGAVTAIDLSPKAIEIGKERGVPASLVAGDFLAHDFGTEPFDAIVIVETLFYVQDQPATMEKVANLLAPGGLVVLTCINQLVYERRSEIGPPEPGQPRHWLSIGQMRQLLSSQFEITALETMDPRGHQGFLRIVNSFKLNELANRMFGEHAVRSWKERRGWGSGVVITARKK